MKGWKTYSSEVVHQNPFMKLVKHDVERPNGYRSPYFVLERPGFSIIIPILKNKRTILVGQYRYTVNYYSWEFPMGSVKGKKPIDVARQELVEETGYLTNKIYFIGKFYVAPGYANQSASVLIASDLYKGKMQPEIGEILQVKQVSLTKIGEMIARQEILDGPTICAYHLLEVYLSKNKL